MPTLGELDRKLSEVFKQLQAMQGELGKVRRTLNESQAAGVGMASMTAEDIDLKLNKILKRLNRSNVARLTPPHLDEAIANLSVSPRIPLQISLYFFLSMWDALLPRRIAYPSRPGR